MFWLGCESVGWVGPFHLRMYLTNANHFQAQASNGNGVNGNGNGNGKGKKFDPNDIEFLAVAGRAGRNNGANAYVGISPNVLDAGITE